MRLCVTRFSRSSNRTLMTPMIRLFLFSLRLLPFAFVLGGCTTHQILTDVAPYRNLVGRRYILNQDCYIFHYQLAPWDLLLGTPALNDYLKRALEKGSGEVTVNQKVSKGNTFVIVKIVREQTIESHYYVYVARVRIGGNVVKTVDVAPLINDLTGPPTFRDDVVTEK